MADNVESYKEKAEEVAAKLQEYCKDTEGWQVSKKTKHFVISHRKSVEFPDGYLYKGEAVLNAKPKVVFQYVEPLPDGKRAQWDKNMKTIQVIKKLNDELRINRVCTASAMMGLISPRDFVDLIIIKNTDDYISTNAISVEGEYAEQKKYVRGWNYQCGVLCFYVPNEPNKCRLVSLVQPDIKGMLPRNLVDSAIPGSMAEFFTSLRSALKDDGELVDDE